MRRLVLLFLVSLLLVFSLGFSEDSWWKEAAKPYRGITIRGISESTPPSKYIKEVLAPMFEKETGIKVVFETTSWDQMYDKSIKDMEMGTGIYDFVYVEQDIIYSYLNRGFLTDITTFMKEHPELVFPDIDLDDFTSFINYFKDPETGHLFALPMEAFIKPYVYRKDLFSNPEIRKAYKEKYGKELEPAKTPEEYLELAKFFTEYAKEHNLELWGTTVQGASHPSCFYEFVETILPMFGVYNWGINLNNYRASVENGGQLNGEKAKKALRWWVELVKYAPPEALQSTWDEVAATMAAGRAAQGFVYGENVCWIATDETRSKVVGKIGVTLPPAYPEVIEDALQGKGYIGYYDGGAFGIPKTSKHKEAALLFIQWVTQKSVQVDFALATGRVIRKSTFEDPELKKADPKFSYYFSLMEKYGKLFAGAPPFPFHSIVVDLGYPYIAKALRGEISPDEALDELAREIDKTLAELGYGH